MENPTLFYKQNSTRDATKPQTCAFAILSTIAFALQTPTNSTAKCLADKLVSLFLSFALSLFLSFSLSLSLSFFFSLFLSFSFSLFLSSLFLFLSFSGGAICVCGVAFCILFAFLFCAVRASGPMHFLGLLVRLGL